MRLRHLAAAALCVLLLAGCTQRAAVPTPAPSPVPAATPTPTPTPPTDEAVFAELMAEVNAKNAALSAPDGALLEQYRYDYDGCMPLVDWEEWKRGAPEEPPEVLPVQDARDEVDFLFRLLRTDYGLYTWFGGDGAFGPAQDRVLAALEGRAEIPTEEYEALLADSLDFICDNHFILGSHRLGRMQILYSAERLEFTRQDGAFYQGERRLLSVDGGDPAHAVKRAVGDDGELTWKLYLTAPAAGRLTVRLEYEDGSEDLELLPAQDLEYSLGGGRSIFRYGIQQGIPVIQMNAMLFPPGKTGPDGLQQDETDRTGFLASAIKIQDYPAAMVNLTQNGGGNGDLPGEWFEALTGETVAPHYCTLRSDYQQTPGSGAFYRTEIPEPGFVRREGGPLLLVLTGRGTGSAAEIFTDLTRGVENTLIVGSNTGGVLTGNMAYTYRLPRSGLSMSWGSALYLWPEGYFAEGVGLEPDVYLTGPGSAGRLAQFLERYIISNP